MRAPDPEPKRQKFRERLKLPQRPRSSTTFGFVIVPTVNVFIQIILAVILCEAFQRDSYDGALLAQGQFMAGMISSSSIAIVTLTFSLTVLSIQIAAQTYSPRLLDDFLKDPMSKIAIAVNMGAFAYCYTLSYYLFLDDEDDSIGNHMTGRMRRQKSTPYVAIHVLSVQALVVTIAFILFIHSFVNGFRLESILNKAVDSCIVAAQTIERRNAKPGVSSSSKRPVHENIPANAFKVMSDDNGYVADFCFHRILEEAFKVDICIKYQTQIGDFVAEGTVLAYVWDAHQKGNKSPLSERISGSRLAGSRDHEVEEKLGRIIAKGVIIRPIRSGNLDVTLGIQQLSDVASKALSAAVNDPFTAIQALDSLSVLFGQLAKMDLGHHCAIDDDVNGNIATGFVRISAPRRSFAYLLSIVDCIRFYGCSDLAVCYRLLRFYGDLGSILTRLGREDRLPVVFAQLEQCLIFCKKYFDEDSREFQSIMDFYLRSLDLMAVSNHFVLNEHTNVEEKELNKMETTYEKPSSSFFRSMMPLKHMETFHDSSVHDFSYRMSGLSGRGINKKNGTLRTLSASFKKSSSSLSVSSSSLQDHQKNSNSNRGLLFNTDRAQSTKTTDQESLLGECSSSSDGEEPSRIFS